MPRINQTKTVTMALDILTITHQHSIYKITVVGSQSIRRIDGGFVGQKITIISPGSGGGGPTLTIVHNGVGGNILTDTRANIVLDDSVYAITLQFIDGLTVGPQWQVIAVANEDGAAAATIAVHVADLTNPHAVTAVQIGAAVPRIGFGLRTTANPYVETNAGVYETVGRFIFKGGTVIGTPIDIKIIGHITGTTALDCRIQDITNALSIATNTSAATLLVPTVNSLGAITNIPTGEAVFEVQVQKNGGGGGDRARISAVEFYF